MTKKNEKSAKTEFKKAKTKTKKPATAKKKEKPYTGGGSLCRVPGTFKPNPNWKEQW
jgi:hypothetical protein